MCFCDVVVLAGLDELGQVIWRAMVVAVKSGQQLTTAITPFNHRDDVHPDTAAFFLACVEMYFLLRMAAPGESRLPSSKGGAPYAASACAARVRCVLVYDEPKYPELRLTRRERQIWQFLLERRRRLGDEMHILGRRKRCRNYRLNFAEKHADEKFIAAMVDTIYFECELAPVQDQDNSGRFDEYRQHLMAKQKCDFWLTVRVLKWRFCFATAQICFRMHITVIKPICSCVTVLK